MLRQRLALAFLPLALFGTIACSTIDGGDGNADSATETPAATEAAATETVATEVTADLSVADLVSYATPSIVRIEGAGSVGTGFIVSEGGLVVTNNHVVESAIARGATVEVTLHDGDVLDATVVGTDESSDIALLRINPAEAQGGLQALEFAPLDEVVVGQEVVAIGFPLDLERGEGSSFSVTRGIISAKNRQIGQGTAILGAIQTDAPITNGNSGGPLLSLSGEVVGVNTAIAINQSIGGVAAGIGFAVGSDTVEAVTGELEELGQVRRAYLGIQNFEAVRPAVARDIGMPDDIGGIRAGAIAPESPVGRAGLVSGDVIVQIGEFEVQNEAGLAVALVVLDPGDIAEVVYYHEGERRTTTVTLGDADLL